MAIIKYSGRGDTGSISNDGGKTWNSLGGSGNSPSGRNGGNQGNTGSSGNKGSTTVNSAGTTWNNYNGATGKQYSVAGSNGTIRVTQKDGSTRTVLPTDADYSVTQKAMQADLQGNGIQYTPTHQGFNGNVDYTTKDYVTGNNNLKYALEQAAKNGGTGQSGTEEYAKSLYNRIGTQRADGTTVTLDDVNRELDRLGLSDYNSSNALLTAGGRLLPGNEFLKYKDDAGLTTNSPDSRWVSYGGQDYLMGGDSANFAQYVNGKTGNLDNLSFLFGNMQNNPYAQQDRDFLNAYNGALNDFNIQAGITPTQNITTNAGNTTYTGNANVDSAISYINNLNNYAQQTGNSDLLAQIEGLLKNGLTATQDWLAQQKQQAQSDAEQQARSAYINNLLAGRAMNETLAAQGLGTSGAMQSAQLGLQNQYNSNINTINQNLGTLLSGLNQQELQAFSDYYSNMGQYTYNISNDEANRALQQAQLALQQQQAAYDQQYQQQQLAMQQAQWEWEKQQAEREYENTLSQQDYNKKLQQASNYWDAYNAGVLGDEGLYNALYGLGLVDNGYWPNGSYTQGATTAQLERQMAQAQLQAQLLANAKKAKGSSSSASKTVPIDKTEDASGGINDVQNLLNLWYTGKPSTNPLTMAANDIVERYLQ